MRVRFRVPMQILEKTCICEKFPKTRFLDIGGGVHKKPTKIPDEIRNDCNSLTYWYGKVYCVGDLLNPRTVGQSFILPF